MATNGPRSKCFVLDLLSCGGPFIVVTLWITVWHTRLAVYFATHNEKVETNQQLTLKEMKPTRVLFTAVWLLLAAKLAQSIMCFSCGFSESNEGNSSIISCEANSEIKNCSLHPDFGDLYDSCFSQVVVVGGEAKIHIKECAISWGCEELEEILCRGNSMEDSENTSTENCRVECCKEDYCNEASAFYGINFMSSSSTIKTILLSSCVAVFHALGLFILW